MTGLLRKKQTHTIDEPWDNDKLDRKQIAIYLTRIIGSIRQPFVISLNSPYGTGKSFFIRNWQKQLQSEDEKFGGYKAVYFNAWETDYSDDPLIAFISSLKEQLSETSSDNEKYQGLVQKGSGYIVRKFIPIVTKGLARKTLGNDAVEEIIGLSNEDDENIISALGEIAEESLKKHEMVKSSIKNFRSYLEEFVQEITEENEHDDKKKLVIFVDELDRCRPSYAIEVLECIKHLFNVEGIVFILAIDEAQLKETIASYYGLGEHGEGYLKKFIDWQINLPSPSAAKYAQYLYEAYHLDEIEKFTDDQNIHSSKQRFINTLSLFTQHYNLTLRQMSQMFTDINLFCRSLPETEAPGSVLLAMIASLKHIIPYSELRAYCLGYKSCEELLNKMEKDMGEDIIFDALKVNWVKFKPKLHSMFMTEKFFYELENENELLIQKLNDHTMKSLSNSETKENRRRHEYISQVYDYCRADDYGSSISYAGYIFKAFEKASNLTYPNTRY